MGHMGQNSYLWIASCLISCVFFGIFVGKRDKHDEHDQLLIWQTQESCLLHIMYMYLYCHRAFHKTSREFLRSGDDSVSNDA